MGVTSVDVRKPPHPRILHVADIHLGHGRVPSIDTANDVRKWLFPKLKDVDIMFVAGDFFDGDISMNSDDAKVIIDLIVDILTMCYDAGVILRILRGTYTHDRNQLSIWDRLFKKTMIPVNFASVNRLEIEKMEKFGITVLYLPDNLPYKSKNDVLDAARTLLTVNNLKSVDYVVMHGEFDHMNYGFVNSNAYNAQDFAKICHGLILSGHIHKPLRHKNVIYAGSINRLAHNEEEAKGFWIVDGFKSTFIENKDATKFVTVDYRNENDFDILLEKHINIANEFGTERIGFLRILISDTNLKQAIANYHNATYPNVKLTFKHAAKNEVTDDKYLKEKLARRSTDVLVIPSLKNISSIVCKHLSAKGIDLNIDIVEMIINGGNSNGS